MSGSDGNFLDQFPDPAPPAAPAPAPDNGGNFLDKFPQPVAKPGSAAGAFIRAAGQGILPNLGGMAAAGAGAEIGGGIGAAIGGPFAPITGPVGGLAGGIAGFMGGADAVEGAQRWALHQLPDSWQDALGASSKQQALDQQQHPDASFLGGLAPMAMTMSPIAATEKAAQALPAGATAFQRLLANPITARLFGGVVQGGMTAQQEYSNNQPLSPLKISIATGFGMMFTHENALGAKLSGAGASLFRPALAPANIAPQAAPPPTDELNTAATAAPAHPEPDFGPEWQYNPGIDHAQVKPGDVIVHTNTINGRPEAGTVTAVNPYGDEHPGYAFKPPTGPYQTAADWEQFTPQDKVIGTATPLPSPSMAQAADAKVVGAGITESVFKGTHAMAPEAEMAAQDAARTELSLTERPQQQDIHDAARRLDPETFGKYDDLQQQASTLRGWLQDYQQAEPDSIQAAQDALDYANGRLADIQGRNVPPATFRNLTAAAKSAQDDLDALTQRAPGDTPEAAQARQHLMAIDEQMRDLAPAVSAAYRRAQEATGGTAIEPEPEEIAKSTPPESQGNPPENEESGTVSAPPVENSPPSIQQQHDEIVSDSERQLLAAGRPADEAHAAAQIIADRYVTRAQRLGGALGQPIDLYRAESARLRGQAAPRAAVAQPEPEFADDLYQAFRPRHAVEWTRAIDDLTVKNFESRNAVLNMGRPSAALVAAGLPARDILYKRDEILKTLSGKHEGLIDQETLRRLPDLLADPILVTKQPNGRFGVLIKDAANHDILIVIDPKGDIGRVEQSLVVSTHPKASPKAVLHAIAENRVVYRDEARSGEWLSKAQRQLPGKLASLPVKEGSETVAPSLRFADNIPTKSSIIKGGDLSQGSLGRVRLNPTLATGRDFLGVEGIRPIMTLAHDADASTFIHESGHVFLGELMRDTFHPAASDELRADGRTALKWLGVDDPATIGRRQHEKFARGFEQYMREGVAPSPGLARVFAQFRTWLTKIYTTLKGLGQPINEDIRGVFDRMLAAEPQRTVIAPERNAPPSLADVHEQDARETEPADAEPAMDRVIAETQAYVQNIPPEILNVIHPQPEPGEPGAAGAAEPGPEGGNGAAGAAEMGRGGAEPRTGAGAGGAGAQREPQLERGGEAGGEGAGVPAEQSGAGQRPVSSGPLGPISPGATEQFDAAASQFTDKAGNIRLANLTSRDDVAQAIRDSAAENNEFIGDRRGVVTDGQVEMLAEALGMDSAALNRRKLGQAFNAEQIWAARKLLVQSATSVSAAMKKVAETDSTDADVMAYAQAKDRHQMIQAQVAGITAEAGRALRAFRSMAGQEQATEIGEFIKGATGRTLFQLREEAKLGSQMNSPEDVSKLMANGMKRSFGRMLLEYWINGLISGLSTHATYSIGNTILTLERMGPETLAAAAIGRARAALGREGERVHAGEAAAQLRGAATGFAPAVKASVEALRTGVTGLLPGEGEQPDLRLNTGMTFARPAELDEATTMRQAVGSIFGLVQGIKDGVISTGAAIKAGGVEGAPRVGFHYSPLGQIPDLAVRGIPVLPIGSAVRVPGRFIAAIHTFFRAMNYSIEKNGAAYHQAATEGLEGSAFNARVADLRQNPTPEIMEHASNIATEATLMGQAGELVQGMKKITNWAPDLPLLGETPIFKFVDPFINIAANVLDQSIVQRTPAGLLSSEIRADLSGKNGNLAADRAAARMLTGTMIAISLGALAAEGSVSGSEPSDPNQAAMWRLAGNQANSVRVGNIWYQVNRLGPLGMLAGLSADMYGVAQTAEKGDIAAAGSAIVHAFAQNILDESFMSGPAELMQALNDSDRYGPAYVRNFLSSFVPFSVGMAQIDRMSDPYSRQARTIMDAILKKVPGQSESLFPRRDIWGAPIPNLVGVGGITSVYEQRVSQDPVNQAMLALGIYPAPVERQIRNVKLSDQEYDDYARIAGGLAKQRLDVIVRSPEWQGWPAGTKHLVIENVLHTAREMASGAVMRKYPMLAVQAYQAKMAKRAGLPLPQDDN